jgi:hypothetical protein
MISTSINGNKFRDIVGEDIVPSQMKEKVDSAKRQVVPAVFPDTYSLTLILADPTTIRSQ